MELFQSYQIGCVFCGDIVRAFYKSSNILLKKFKKSEFLTKLNSLTLLFKKINLINVSCIQDILSSRAALGLPLYARYLCSRDAPSLKAKLGLGLAAVRPSARATIGYLVYKAYRTSASREQRYLAYNSVS